MTDTTITAPSPHQCLSLVLPDASAQTVIDWLLGHDDGRTEFSVQRIEARGPMVPLSSGDEQVLGYARRAQITLLLPGSALAPLLADLAPLLASVSWGHWVMPVSQLAVHHPATPAQGAA